ncbi:E3 SUMO-protein ligase ZBED1 [Labeo rohita]|uniref:E3 SUMO-protein ligase ZBED1 n=1 Tax=Labeo rohita TaxID=84645 RepID=A0ABQ8MV77_LABRO|nr:E3 SUMO-protein ligase ZBED1 [Labeo rohita]
MPSRKYFRQVELPSLYMSCLSEVENELRDVAHFATNTDLWTSRSTQPYMSLTIHFITSNWTLCSRCLQTSYFPGDHTGDLIAQGLRESLQSWGLQENRQVCVTTDNATNNIRALQLNNWTRLQCFGHRLHLAIEKGMKLPQVDRAVGVCKKVVSAFSNTWKRRRELAVAQGELGLPVHQLITETVNRWGSRQKMIDRVIEQEKAISQVLREDKKTRHLIPTWQDMDVLEFISKALRPLTEFTDALSGEDYVSVSYLKPVLHLFNKTIVAPQEDDTQLTKNIKDKILEYLNEKYADPDTEDLLDMASFVDPRFKTKYIKEEKVEYIMSKAAAEIEEMVVNQNAESPVATQPETEEAVADPAVPAKKKHKGLGSYFKKKATQQVPPLSNRNLIDFELKSYLQAMETDSDTDPLQWWKLHEMNFPKLSNLAKKYLCIPATSSPSERAFSTSGNIVTCHRSVLKPETVDQLVFLAHNLK